MKLEFKPGSLPGGRERWYPVNREARAVVDLTGRKCLRDVELRRLTFAGFTVVRLEVPNESV